MLFLFVFSSMFQGKALLKSPWNQRFSEVFRRYRNWILAWNALRDSYNEVVKISHNGRRKSEWVCKWVLQSSLKDGQERLLSEKKKKKCVLKSFAKFDEKLLCWSLFVNKVTGLSTITLLKRDSKTDVFLWIL